jgi:hypothetical protein
LPVVRARVGRTCEALEPPLERKAVM